MAVVTDRLSLIQYCKRELGQGAIDINVTDEQCDDRVDEMLDYFQQFHFDGLEKKYLSIQVQAGDIANQYFQLPNTVFNVTRIFPLNGDTVSNNSITGDFNIFDLNYQLRLNEMYDFTSADYVYFELANQHLRTLEMLFIGDIPLRYNRYTNLLYLDMNWDNRVGVGTYVIVECYCILPSSSSLFWNDMFVKAYTTALIKRQWGNNLKKHKGTPLPGGITVDGQGIYDEAVAEITELKETLRSTFEVPVMFEVG